LWNGIVDVRDAAAAHIKAGYTPEASGRHIIVSGEATLLDLANMLRKHFGDDYPFPRKQVPKFLFWLISPAWLDPEIREQKCRYPDQIRQLIQQERPEHVVYPY